MGEMKRLSEEADVCFSVAPESKTPYLCIYVGGAVSVSLRNPNPSVLHQLADEMERMWKDSQTPLFREIV